MITVVVCLFACASVFGAGSGRHHSRIGVSEDGHLQQIDDDGDAQEDAVRHAALVRRIARLRVACERRREQNTEISSKVQAKRGL